MSLWEEFASVSYMLLLFIVGKRILLGFLGFFIDFFPVLRILLVEVFGGGEVIPWW